MSAVRRPSKSAADNAEVSGQLHSQLDEALGESSASEGDNQHALEVVFDGEDVLRRKSSLIPGEESTSAKPEDERSTCFVHSLLEKQGSARPTSSNGTEDVVVEKGVDGSHSTPTHSRHLTKKQLSEMAWGVRKLSKQLGSVRLKLKVHNIFILTKAYDVTLIAKTRELVEWLLSKERAASYVVYVEDTLEHNRKFNGAEIVAQASCGSARLKYWTNDMAAKHPHKFDFVITLGGDGTLLYASWLFQRIVPPVLSFSMGSLGFLTKFDFAQYQETLTSAFADGVTVSLRLRFEGTIMRSQHKGDVERDLVEELLGDEVQDKHTHKPDGHFEILNEIVVDRGPNPTLSTIEVIGDSNHFTTIQADGVCIATPTGSTAYNLAAGGSLCHPDNPVILVTAICAHTLSFRPIILPDTMVLRVGVPYNARTSSWASFDGREKVELCPGDYVTISASRFPFANVMRPHQGSEDWVNSISRTLMWNSRQKQKAFTSES